MTLILGDSFAARLARSLRSGGSELPGVASFGIPGGRLSSSRHRMRLLAAAEAQRPRCVVLVIGGNDLCPRDFDLRRLADDVYSLGMGLEALGVTRVWLLPIPPRIRTRVGDVSVARYEERRRAANIVLATRFRWPPVTIINMEYPSGSLGHDGVHLSRRGEEFVLAVVARLHG